MLPDAGFRRLNAANPFRFGRRRDFALLLLFSTLAFASCRKPGDDPDKLREARSVRFTQALDIALESSRGLPVRYSDDLGEGPGAWDPDPRLPNGTVNCTSWWQSVLTEAYTRAAPVPWEPLRLKQKILDLIRYHDGVPLFGYRRHFLDVALDPSLEATPGPLKRFDLHQCAGARIRSRSVRPDFSRWKSFSGFSCPLRDEDLLDAGTERKNASFDFIGMPDLRDCIDHLDPERRYAGFPVSSPKYDSIYGKNTGPLGQVHGYILKLNEYPEKLREARKRMGAPLKQYYLEATHAKLTTGKIDSFVLWPDSAYTMGLFDGITLYEIDPDWDWESQLAQAPQASDRADVQKSAACEAALPRRGPPRLFVPPAFLARKRAQNPPSNAPFNPSAAE